MPKQGKSPKKKTKEKSPQRTGESEYPEMDQDEFNRRLQNAIEQVTAQLQHARGPPYGDAFQRHKVVGVGRRESTGSAEIPSLIA